MIGIVSTVETWEATEITHQLESQGQAFVSRLQTQDRHSSHSQTGESRIGIVSRLETQYATAATYSLESHGQTLLAGLQHSKPQQPLTFWKAKNRHCQQA